MAVAGCAGLPHFPQPTSTAGTATAPALASSTKAPISTPRPRVTSRVAPAAISPDRARLNRIVVQPGDLHGWTRHRTSDDGSDGPGRDSSDCSGPDTSGDVVATTESADYWRNDADISAWAGLFESDRDVDNDAATLLDPLNSHCDAKSLGQDMLSDEPKGSKLVSSTATTVGRSERQPRNLVATEVGIVRVRAPGEVDVVYVDSAFIRGPRTEVEVDFINLGSPVPASVRARVISRVCARAARA